MSENIILNLRKPPIDGLAGCWSLWNRSFGRGRGDQDVRKLGRWSGEELCRLGYERVRHCWRGETFIW